MAHRTTKSALIAGASLACISIIAGALGAHALEGTLTVESLSSYDTAVQYTMYHGLALLILGKLRIMNPALLVLMLGGVILFSGSILLLTLDHLVRLDFSSLGIVTPLGGILMITAWIGIIIQLWREKSKKTTRFKHK